MQLHHIDGDPSNNGDANLAVVCLNCHSRVTGDEGLGRRYSELEVAEFKRRWEDVCARSAIATAERHLIEKSVAARTSAELRGPLAFEALFSNPNLARTVGATVGVEIGDKFGVSSLEELLKAIQPLGRLRLKRPDSLNEFDPQSLVHETVDATKVIFPHRVLTATVPNIRELAVWVADPYANTLEMRGEDPFDFSGSFLYLVAPLYDDEHGSTFYSGCSALQVIANLVSGRPFVTRDGAEPFGRSSFLHPVDKLRSMGGIIVDRRPIETLYKCRYMSDEQSFADGERMYRGHDLLGYPLFIGNSLQHLSDTWRNK